MWIRWRAARTPFRTDFAHGTHDRRPAREVAQALDIVVGHRGRVGCLGRGILFTETLIEDGLDVLEGGHHDLHSPAENDAGGAQRGGIFRIRHRH